MNIFNVWLKLSPQNRILSILSVLATITALYFLVAATLKTKTDLLYSGLDPAAAGEIIAKLETMDVVYEVKGNSIYADKARRDSLRLELAREGLPRQNTVGYELFDNMNSFAMTSDMFNTAYWRAKEGELARTLLAMPSIRSARVHLGTQKSSGFASQASAKSASVTIATSGTLGQSQAKAIQYLTALAVSGLNPSDVAVIDATYGVIAGPGMGNEVENGAMLEVERASQIKQNLISLLEARVGVGNARVNVSLDVDRQHITTAERSFDPESRVLKSQTTNDLTDTSSGTNSSVTVASNLPEGDAAGGNNTAERSETSETVTYEISEVVRNTEILPGQIKRLTVAVLINDIIARDADGVQTRTPRSPEELSALQELVSAAAGLDEERGDKLELKSLSFNQRDIPELIEQPTLMEQFLDRYLWSTIQAALLAIVILVLGLFVVRPLLTQRPEESAPGLMPMALEGTGGPAMELPTLGGPGGDDMLDALAGPALPSLGEPMRIGTDLGMGASDPIEELKAITTEQSADAADVLTSWLDNDQRRAS